MIASTLPTFGTDRIITAIATFPINLYASSSSSTINIVLINHFYSEHRFNPPPQPSKILKLKTELRYRKSCLTCKQMNRSNFFVCPLLLIFIILIEFGLKCPAKEEPISQFRRLLFQKNISITSATERENRSRGSTEANPLRFTPDRNCPNCQCGVRRSAQERRPRILGGMESYYGEYPWQVSIEKRGRDTLEQWRHHCGGSLISKRNILTAAHCFQDHLSDYRVIVGNYHLNKTDISEQVFELREGDYINNRDFGSRSEYDNDISIVRLCSPDDRGVELDQYVQPICLPEKEMYLPPGTSCHVSGWGTKDKHKPSKSSSVLQWALVPIHSHRHCSDAYNGDDLRENYLRRLYFNERLRKKSVVHEGNLCAGGGTPEVCSGDSGGPLTCRHPDNPNKFFLMGIVSWGKGCGSKTHPGIYTKVSHYLKWIQTEIALSHCSHDRYHYYQK